MLAGVENEPSVGEEILAVAKRYIGVIDQGRHEPGP
jgi:hypothetical protein